MRETRKWGDAPYVILPWRLDDGTAMWSWKFRADPHACTWMDAPTLAAAVAAMDEHARG